MSNSPKFMVFHLRELIYTLAIIILGITVIVMLVLMFNNKEPLAEATSTYIPGVYSSTINLSDASFELKMTVDGEHINSITMENIDDSITTMYPLLQPTFDDIAKQIIDTQSLDNIQCAEENTYTGKALLKYIENLKDEALNTANAN